MQGSALYGVFIGIAFLLSTRLLPQPAGSMIFFGWGAAHLTWGAMICWQRTALPFATAAMLVGAALSAFLAALAAIGRIFPDLSPELWFPVGFGLVFGPVLLLIESRMNRAKWKQWADYMERKSAWDIVTGRHIPRLRNGG